jgi:hypothetical protein
MHTTGHGHGIASDAASCSLPLSKRREQLKRTTGEPQHDISRDACGLNRAA